MGFLRLIWLVFTSQKGSPFCSGVRSFKVSSLLTQTFKKSILFHCLLTLLALKQARRRTILTAAAAVTITAVATTTIRSAGLVNLE